MSAPLTVEEIEYWKWLAGDSRRHATPWTDADVLRLIATIEEGSQWLMSPA